MKKLHTAAEAALLLAACSPEPGNAPKLAETPRNALEEAKKVEAIVNQQAEQQRQQIDQQTE